MFILHHTYFLLPLFWLLLLMPVFIGSSTDKQVSFLPVFLKLYSLKELSNGTDGESKVVSFDPS
jgi:hypothetical protein